MRAFPLVSLAVLLAACGNEAETGRQSTAQLPDTQSGMTDGSNGDANDDLRADEPDREARDAQLSSIDWDWVEGPAINDLVDLDDANMAGEFGGSASATVRHQGGMYAISDTDRSGRQAVVWTAGGIQAENGIIRFSFDLEGATDQTGWIGVTLSHRDANGYSRTHCAFGPNGEAAEVISDNAEGEADSRGSMMRCTLHSEVQDGDLDLYFYPTAFHPDTGWTDSLMGEVFVSNLRVEAGR